MRPLGPLTPEESKFLKNLTTKERISFIKKNSTPEEQARFVHTIEILTPEEQTKRKNNQKEARKKIEEHKATNRAELEKEIDTYRAMLEETTEK